MVGVVIEPIGLDVAAQAIGRLIADQEFSQTLAELVVNQTKERIDTEKSGPDGTPWAAWSAQHSGSRHDNQSLLLSEGDLQGSIVPFVQSDRIEVGSGLVYGAVHQFGSRDGSTPARPFLGLSEENLTEIEDLAQVWFEDLLT